jgi:hypothetical protein
MSNSSVHLHVANGVDELLVAELAGRLNRKGWPPVHVSASTDSLAFVAQTWQPVLKVRVEEAIEGILGTSWGDYARWL